MWCKAEKCGDPAGTYNGMILLNEMSIQQDLQVVKRGHDRDIVGAVDLGPLVNGLEYISKKKKELQMASHYLQYMYVGFNGFRWPVAHYGTMSMAIQSFFTFWPLLDVLHSAGFDVHRVLMDGSNNNHQFSRLHMKAHNARACKYSVLNLHSANSHVSLIQDCKHVFKKIHSSILSSRRDVKSVWQLQLKGKFISWEHFTSAYDFNTSSDLRLYRKLSKDHVDVTNAAKMRNYLAINVLNSDMLNLMCTFQGTLDDPHELDSTILLLEHTQVIVDIFCNINSKIESMHDSHIQTLVQVLEFFHTWENESVSTKDKNRHLITRQTWEDIDLCIYGFIEMISVTSKLSIPIVPGYFNSDFIENWFCQMHTIRNGANQNPTLCQIGPAINSNLITGSLFSKKSNSGGCGKKYSGVLPPTKILKTE